MGNHINPILWFGWIWLCSSKSSEVNLTWLLTVSYRVEIFSNQIISGRDFPDKLEATRSGVVGKFSGDFNSSTSI